MIPVEQYTDSGETLRVDGGSLLPGAALRELLVMGSLPAASPESSPSDPASLVDKKSTTTWNKLHGGWGKRDSSSQANWNRMRVWGKRSPNGIDSGSSSLIALGSEYPSIGVLSPSSGKWNQLNNLWGKKRAASAPSWNNLNQMWGKKRGWNDMNNVWGKRSAPHWNNLRGMWG